MIVEGQEEAVFFSKPQLALDMRSNTFVLMGTAEKKPIQEVLQELLSSIDFSKFAKKAEKEEGAADDLGDVPEDVDFSKPAEEAEKPVAD